MNYHFPMPCLRWSRAILLLLAVTVGQACSVPVFAYALRKWEPTPHTIQTARGAAWIATTNRTLEDQNAWVTATDASAAGSGVFWPGGGTPWHSGEIEAGRLEGLITSPVRRELIRRLVAGDAVVWLFVPGGDAVADAAALERLGKRLRALEGTIELPPRSELGYALPPLRFSILECPAADPAEWAMLAQLRALAKQTDGSLIAPVFGRGRVLSSQPTSEWTDERIDSVTFFLTGPCSCQVKEMNPGSDLLICADWMVLFANAQAAAQAEAQVVPPATTDPPPATTDPPPAPVERVVIGAAPPTEPVTSPSSLLSPRLWSMLGLGLLLAVALAIALATRRARR